MTGEHASSRSAPSHRFGPAGERYDDARPPIPGTSEMTMTSQVQPSPSQIRCIVELASRAPSVHNTQPWWWRVWGTTLELRTDPSRQLSRSDPLGRNLMVSCGATLHHAQVAAESLGWVSTVTRHPGGTDPTLVASLVFRLGAAPDVDFQRLIEERCTDRRRFTSWPVPDGRLQQLAAVANEWGVRALPLTDVSDRSTVERLVGRALECQSTDRGISIEQREWVDHSRQDGVPSTVLPDTEATEGERGRFGVGSVQDSTREIEGSDGLIVISSAHDDKDSWLRAGEALSALWLAAVQDGLSIVPLSQVVEVDETRVALQNEVLGGIARPLILVRVGWQSISRCELPRTSRRPLGAILDLSRADNETQEPR